MSAIQEPPAQETPATTGSLNLAKVLQQMLEVSDKVSDLIFSPGRPPQVELVSKLQPVAIPGLEKRSRPKPHPIAKLIIGRSRESSIESLAGNSAPRIFLSAFPRAPGSAVFASTFSSSEERTRLSCA